MGTGQFKSVSAANPSKFSTASEADPQPRSPILGIRDVRFYRASDALSGILIWGMVILGPWAFGTTQPATIRIMNMAGYTLGLLLAVKWFIRHFKGYRPSGRAANPTPSTTKLTQVLAALTLAILAYTLISALNARASWRLENAYPDYHAAIAWLPQSYARENTWRAFGNFLALAGFFWAIRDWLHGTTVAEERMGRQKPSDPVKHGTAQLPDRLRGLLWVLCLNGALLAAESIAQRLSGTNKLLWLMETRINKEALDQFGPYAYRANAAQYFNLVWPVCLGFWWTLRRELRHRQPAAARAPAWRTHGLLAAVLLMAAAPIISASRAGAAVSFAAMIVATAILLFGLRRRHSSVKFAVVLFFASTLATALYLGWDQLGDRFKGFESSYGGRENIYDTARKIARDFPLFGTGPGTFEPVFQLYRSSEDEYWPAQLHNDWLETRITFGWVGSALIALALLCTLARWFLPGKIPGGWRLTSLLWLALAGCLVHARFDFPFQIYSILQLFLLECAILFTIARRQSEL